MPLIGLALGAALARGSARSPTTWQALPSSPSEPGCCWRRRRRRGEAGRLTATRGLALIALGVSISLDELAIGFTIGLTHLPATAVIVAIALQAFIAAELGLAIGTKIGERWRERAEQAAGIALIVLGAYLIGEQLAQ